MMKKLLLLLGFTLSMTVSILAQTQTIVFGAGCFWGVEKHFDDLDGVIKARSGYAGGNYENPTYKQVLQQRNAKRGVVNHTEVVEIVYDDSKISTETLVKSFWELHNPTQGNRQGNDKGNNYRSALYYTNDAQKKVAKPKVAIKKKPLKKLLELEQALESLRYAPYGAEPLKTEITVINNRQTIEKALPAMEKFLDDIIKWVDSPIVSRIIKRKKGKELFNTLKNQGYNLEHNYGLGKKHLSAVFAHLMLLAFLVDQVQQMCCPLFQAAQAKYRTRRYLWERIRGYFNDYVAPSMEVILHW